MLSVRSRSSSRSTYSACVARDSLSPADSAAVSDALARYRAAWLAGNADSVMAHVSDSMVLYVPGAVGTLRGSAATRAYWFPPSGDTTYPITRYDIEGERIHGTGDLAIVEGRSVLTWAMLVGDSTHRGATSTSEFLTVMRREGGRWMISRNMFVAR